jgi:hypothetical protein
MKQNGWLVAYTLTMTVRDTQTHSDHYEVFLDFDENESTPKEQAIQRLADLQQRDDVYSASVCEIKASTEQTYTNLDPDLQKVLMNSGRTKRPDYLCDIDYLTYEIVNSGNGDGFVVVKDGCSDSNHSTLENALAWATLLFMVDHPEIYGHCILQRLFSGKDGGTVHEYYLLKGHLESLGIEMPHEISWSDGHNMLIQFRKHPLGLWPSKNFKQDGDKADIENLRLRKR